MTFWTLRKIVLCSGGFGLATYNLVWSDHQLLTTEKLSAEAKRPAHLKMISKKGLPSRADHIKALKETPEYDVLVVGGGATGSGVALDAVTRGLKTALVEMDDFSSGTSSRSTKLIHGGVRYLQKAILKLDYDQYRMVKEALHERANLLEIAPHLSYPFPIMLPVYHWWQIPYFWVGIKAYDFVAGSKNVKSSYYLSKKKALEHFPMLKKEKLCGAIVYYDGQHNDARMNLALILTAVRYGANCANHVGVTELIKDENGQLCGAKLKDNLTGEEWPVKAKVIINATGPFTDSIRRMDNPDQRLICQPSAGVHITLPGYYSPDSMGLLDPATSDGRVIFFLPWQKFTIAGTTDTPCEVSTNPSPSEADIQFILQEIKKYLNSDVNVRRGDVMSAWSGIRPLVLDPSKGNTESIARNHIIDISESGLITIAGGKWTTYRSMAAETIDAAVKKFPDRLKPLSESQTDGLLLEGGDEWTPTMFIRLVQDYGIEPEVANHLANTYGDRAFAVAKLAELTGRRWPVVGNRLHPEFPYIAAEVRFAIREYACNAVDVIARRLRLSFLNVEAAEEVLPKIIEIMSQELKWSKKEAQAQYDKAIEFLHTEMGKNANKQVKMVSPLSLSATEINKYTSQFHSMDKEKKGYITINDLRRSFKALGQKVSDEELHVLLSEVDVNKNGQVELGEYLWLISALKSGDVATSVFAAAVELEHQRETGYKQISVERSGGGV
ncbi:glycerol-3-phosphate dehydrogenase, mitochondrial [Tetranychus urticae]|nr:glycerol-3-phosphate dehydrogenase, mitochondrial [Tetranychus urticae]